MEAFVVRRHRHRRKTSKVCKVVMRTCSFLCRKCHLLLKLRGEEMNEERFNRALKVLYAARILTGRMELE